MALSVEEAGKIDDIAIFLVVPVAASVVSETSTIGSKSPSAGAVKAVKSVIRFNSAIYFLLNY
jgi:hypothetical protein